MNHLAGSKLYLDANVIIYAAEGAKIPFVDRLNRLLLRVDQGEMAAVTSELTLAEVLVKPFRTSDQRLLQLYERRFSSGDTLKIVPVSRPLLIRAARLRAATPSLRLPDAIHAATALAAGCDHFLTNDARLRDAAGLTVLPLSDLPA